MIRSLLTATALLLPVVFIVLLSDKIAPAPAIYHNNEKAAEITSKIRPAPKVDNRLPSRIAPGSLEEAKWLMQKRLLELEKMTEAEWQAQRKSREDFSKKWDSLSDEQKLKAIGKLQEKKVMGRAPEVEGAPAAAPTP